MNFDRGAISYWIAFCGCLLPHLLSSSPPPPLVPETGEGRDNVIRPDCRFQQCWVNPFGWATIDTCAVSGKHRSAIIGERWSTSSMTASWGLVPPGTGGTGLIATFMALEEDWCAADGTARSFRRFLPFALLKQRIWQMRVKVLEETMGEI